MNHSSRELYEAMKSVITEKDPEGAKELFGGSCHWERVKEFSRASAVRRCSSCGLIIQPEVWWKHCPGCGAKIENAPEN